MNVILSVSSFYEVCSAVSRSISWARCLAACGYSEVRVAAIFKTDKKKQTNKKGAHFLAFVAKVEVVTTEVSQSEELREWDGIFYVLWMRGRMQQVVMRISWFVVYASG